MWKFFKSIWNKKRHAYSSEILLTCRLFVQGSVIEVVKLHTYYTFIFSSRIIVLIALCIFVFILFYFIFSLFFMAEFMMPFYQ